MRSIELYVIGLILPDLKIQLNLNELLLINVKLGFGAKCHQNVILFLQSSTLLSSQSVSQFSHFILSINSMLAAVFCSSSGIKLALSL